MTDKIDYSKCGYYQKFINNIKCVVGIHKYKIICKNNKKIVKKCKICKKTKSTVYDMFTGETYWINGNLWQ